MRALHHRGRGRRRRAGKIMAMTGVMMPLLFAGALVSNDTAVLATAQSQLKTMTDAAALAGAAALISETRLTGTSSLSSVLAQVRSKVSTVAGKNLVLGTVPILADNASNGASGDVVVGYLSPADTTSTTVNNGASASTFNAVMVRGYRNASHGGAVGTFFGPALSIGPTDLDASSVAIAQNYEIKSIASVSAANVDLLPIVLDQTTYNSMCVQGTSDLYAWNSTTGAVAQASDGVYESNIVSKNSELPGNWGTIKIGVTNNSTATLESQILYGITPAQLAAFPNSTIQLDTALSPPSITFGGNPGLSAGIKDSLTAQIGKVKVIGIYDTASGNGNNTTYRVVKFAPVRIMAVKFTGNPKYVVVQPALTRSASFTPGAAKSNWISGGVARVYLAR